jgi:hypothetical protein
MALMFALAPATIAAEQTSMRFANLGTAEVECWVDDALECRLPPKYECNFDVKPGKHVVEIIRPDNSGYRDAFKLPAEVQGKTYYRGQYLIGDSKVNFTLPLEQESQAPTH